MSNARKLAAKLPTEGQLSNRRININGAMQVAQRGTARTVSDGGAEGYQTLDRWYALFSSSAGGVATISQDTTVPSGYGFSNSYKVDVATADTSIDANHAITIQYRFEAQDIRNSGWDYTNSNSNMSVSFWARSVKAGTYCVFFYTHDGTSKNLVQEYTLEANTWKNVKLTFKGDSGISFNDDNGLGLTVGWALVAGSNRYQSVTAGTWITGSTGNGQARYATSNQVNFFDNTANNFFLTGVQIEVGSQSTPFEHRSYGDEFLRCCRYYYSLKGQDEKGQGGKHIGGGVMRFATGFYGFPVTFPAPMRAVPTLTYANITPYVGDASNGYATVSIAAGNTDNFAINGSNSAISGASAGSAVLLYLGTDANHYLRWDAEL